MYHGLGTTDLSVTGSGDGVILAKAAADQAERNRAALAYQAMVDQRNMTYGIAALVAVVAVGWWASKRYTPNKRHRVRRGRKSPGKVSYVRIAGRKAGGELSRSEARKVRAFVRSLGLGAVEGDGGAPFGEDLIIEYAVPASKANTLRSKIRSRFGLSTSFSHPVDYLWISSTWLLSRVFAA